MPCQQNKLKESWFLMVSVSGNCCLVPWSVIPVDASDSFDTILDVNLLELESMRLYKKCDTEVRPLQFNFLFLIHLLLIEFS